MSYETRSEMEMSESERSIAELFRQLSRDLGTLLRQESELARTEVRQKAGQVAIAGAAFGSGGLVGFAGFLILLQALVAWLAGVLDSTALAALLVGGLALLAGAGLVLLGRSRLKAEKLVPRKTVESLRQDAELATGHGATGGDDYTRNARRSM
jgi:hypothetical protein